jgi:peptidoglycan/xylan/chitin deacetylase (PgdA/CDA1 family)
MKPIRGLALALSLAALPTAAGAAPSFRPGAAVPAALEHGPRTAHRVALTFDACTTRDPSPFDPRIPRVLDALRVPATFFVGGGWALEERPELEALARDPLFEIGNHTFSHPHLTRIPDAAIREELLRTQAVVAAETGRAPTLFRPPFGEYDARVLRIASELGLTTVEYDLPSGDPDPRATKDALVRWVLREARPGSIVVMHVNHRRFHTAEALPEIVAGLRARGLELVKVSELAGPPRVPGVSLAAAAPREVRRTRAHHHGAAPSPGTRPPRQQLTSAPLRA